jgi:hypothetical protein
MRATLALSLTLAASTHAAVSPWFAIHILDDATNRGIPLAELRTVSEASFISDNAGRIALADPDLMNRPVWFHVSSPGYSLPKDGFGYSGVRLVPKPGASTEIRLSRSQPAERIARLTGLDRWRDSLLLNLPAPSLPADPFGVTGQDSTQATPWHGRIFWLWGDTSITSYPLGNFKTTCATSDPVTNPENGFAFSYLADPDKPDRLRTMMPREGPGVVWMQGLLNVPDTSGNEQLVAHWGRSPGLAPVVEQGIAVFNESLGTFQNRTSIPKDESWRFPRGHVLHHKDHFYFASPLPHTRVKANFASVTQPDAYEALRFNEPSNSWIWQRLNPPTTQKDEAALIAAGKLPAASARFQITDAATSSPILIHGASVRWNPFRNRFLLIGVATGTKNDPSYLGEVWFAESTAPDGPFSKAVKIATHPAYSFYNPVHHPFMDQQNGRLIHFEGTYTAEFSGNPRKTPRYDYNQILYRLDLSHPTLTPALTP